MNLLAKLPRIAAIIYRHKYRNSNIINADNTLDWAANFAHMLGSDDLNMR
jgi:citrate synthase